MALDPKFFSKQLESFLPMLGDIDYPTAFSDAYDAYAMGGEIIGAPSGGGNKAAIKGALAGLASTPASVDVLAQSFADYWSSFALVGDGAHGGAPVSVVNDASTKVSAFKSAIQSSMGNAEQAPYYEAFAANIEAVVKTIVWTVTEAMPPAATPTAFPEMIA